MMVVTALGLTTGLYAQDTGEATFWVIEKNLKEKKTTLVRFYNEREELVDEVAINRTISLDKRKHIHYLNGLLTSHKRSAFIATTRRRMKL